MRAPDPLDVSVVLGGLAALLLAAKLLGTLFERLGQPSVLGELLAGVVLGNLPLVGVDVLAPVFHAPSVAFLAELGVLILLFEVGLESDIRQMLRVGPSSFAVAVVGVVAPMVLGYGVARWLVPGTWHVHLFIGAVLTATSVGITARVLKDLGKIQSTEGRIILGAAVIDDVLGLIVLAVVQGLVASQVPGGEIDGGGILWIVAKATLFLGGAILLGGQVSRWLFRAAGWLPVRGLALPLSLAVCFSFSAAAGAIGLASIVGAFAAGLILDEVTIEPVRKHDPSEQGLEEQVRPLGAFLMPIFFVTMGAQVDLRSFTQLDTLALAGGLTAAAFLGKQVCGLAVLERGLDRLSVGLGMVPRGEVGLIFVAFGSRLTLADGTAVISRPVATACVVMIFLTTLVTPPVLGWSLRRAR